MDSALRTPVRDPDAGSRLAAAPPDRPEVIELDPVQSHPVRSKGSKVEQWGLCVSCDRWFYCGTSVEQSRDCRCPACDQAPVAIRETWE
ncbi:MAG TPA: hypothetical protein VNU01_13035 [Egibacteraceae bacterium]|nr:hypothetical protein [Egibacteraceae bacterium]